jgi:hypothetical protein
MPSYFVRVVLVAFVLFGGTVRADDVKSEIKYLTGLLDQGERRINDQRVLEASGFIDGARRGMEKTSRAAKATSDFAQLQARYNDLANKLELLRAATTRAAAADKELMEAGVQKDFGAANEGAAGLPFFRKCLEHVEAALKADPTAETKAAPYRKACQEGATGAQEFANGGGRTPPDDLDEGKLAKDGLLAAQAVLKQRDLEAADLIKGQKDAKQCLEGLRIIGSSVLSHSGQPLYDFSKHTLTLPEGAVTLGEVRKRCTAILADLGNRKVKGCGAKGLFVTQPLVAEHPDRWGQTRISISEEFTPAKCGEVPAGDRFPGSSRALAGSLKAECKGGVIVMDDASWSGPSAGTDGTLYRQMTGTCWVKGTLNFKLPW